MHPLRRIALLTAAIITVIIGGALPSQAASSMWFGDQQTTNPTVYQTNLTYPGTAFAAFTSTPSVSSITDVQYSWTVLSAPPAGTHLYVYLCQVTGTRCTADLNPSNTTTATGTDSTSFTGLTAKQNFVYKLYLYDSTTHTVSPIYSSKYHIQVNYTY